MGTQVGRFGGGGEGEAFAPSDQQRGCFNFQYLPRWTHSLRFPFVNTSERGRSIFEGILRNYPKRLDLWSVYIDQEIKTGDEARIRQAGSGDWLVWRGAAGCRAA